jgi:hemolysin III
MKAQWRTTVVHAKQKQRLHEADEIAVDHAIHVIGVFAGALGSAALVGIALDQQNEDREWWPIMAYSACLMTMLCCSAAYNLSGSTPHREMLRRADHAAIFFLIAGTYTPFTTRMLPEQWGFWMTGSIWASALVGALFKLRCPHRLERVDLALYLALGWTIVVAWKPLLAAIDSGTAFLIFSGGILYTVGAVFHAWRELRFQNAIWHAFVLVAAGCHYAAVLRTT